MVTDLAVESFSQELVNKMKKDGAMQDPKNVAKGMVLAVARWVVV